MNDIAAQKAAMRQDMKERRDKLQGRNSQAGILLRDNFLKHVSLPPASVIAGFKSFGSEINILPLMEILRDQGHAIALPVVQGRGGPLIFRLYNKGDELLASKFGVEEPLPSAPLAQPDILLAPLLAFDAEGWRLGYGGGFYDRTLSALRQSRTVTAIGIGLACQQVPAVPHATYDARLDKVVTETEVFSC